MVNKDSKLRAKEAYNIINKTTEEKIINEGVVSFLGPMGAFGKDAYAIAKLYSPMINEIRKLYGRKALDEEIIIDSIQEVIKEIINDIRSKTDMGVYFHYIASRVITSRIGILFTMLASHGEKSEFRQIKETMILIKSLFPNESSTKFDKPNYKIFEKIVISVESNTISTYSSKIKML